MSPAIWRRTNDQWQPLLPDGFASEAALHDLIEEAPHLLPLAGDPTLTIIAREFAIGPGYVDLLAVDSTGRVTIIEIKLRRSSEARRAVVAQILMYAAFLNGMKIDAFEASIRSHLGRRDAVSMADLVGQADQSGQFDAASFTDSVAESLASGTFRLVLVLDETPNELVQLVGYSESITTVVSVDLITVSSFNVGADQILVPQRVDPEHMPDPVLTVPRRAAVRTGAAATRQSDGAEAFEQTIEQGSAPDVDRLLQLTDWAKGLEERQLATLKTTVGEKGASLLVWFRGDASGAASVGSATTPLLWLWRSALIRRAWQLVDRIEQSAGKTIGQGTTIHNPSDELLSAVAEAYEYAAAYPPTWNGNDFYVSFGEDPRRDWDDAVAFGFVAAGGGAWYSRTLKQLRPGNRLFVYIPLGSKVGGYVGVATVVGEAMMARDFSVTRDGVDVPYLDVARAVNASEGCDDPALSEWIVPVAWVATRTRETAVRDSDFFANQNSAVKLTHDYTLQKLIKEFGLQE